MKDPNELVENVPRLGWLVDGDPTTPEVATLLQDNGKRITLTVPWDDAFHGSPYERWFAGEGTEYGDDPDRARFTYKVPDILWFEDLAGPVVLVGCRNGGYSQTLGSVGQGVVNVAFAVLGGRGDYRTINGLRSEVPGLADWIGLRSVSRERHTEEGRLSGLTLSASAPAPLPLDRALNLHIRPTWRTSTDAGPDSIALHESLEIETLVSRPRTWDEHLDVHRRVRELLSVAAWKPMGHASQWVQRSDDPIRVMSGEAVDTRWAPVRTHSLRNHAPLDDRTSFLFHFHHIGVQGYRRWVRIQRQFRRGIVPLVGLVDFPNMPLEMRVAQSGIGFEALGLALAIEAGCSRGPAEKENHRKRLQRIADDLPSGIIRTVIDDLSGWADRSASAYNGVKHADREMPDLLTLVNVERENELVFRAWVANRIGVAHDHLERSLDQDPLAGPHRLA